MEWRIRQRLGAAETWLALALGWLLVFALPFRRTAAWLGQPKAPGAGTAIAPDRVRRARFVCRRVARIARQAPWRTTCLVQAIAGALLLKRRGIPAVLRLGVCQNDGVPTAHAWLIVGTETVLGGEAANGFTPLADLGQS